MNTTPSQAKGETAGEEKPSAETPATREHEHEQTGRAFRKKPVVIEAMQVVLGRAALITDWMGRDSSGKNRHAKWDGRSFHIATLEGTMCANPGDWIIKGVKGEFYPCKPDIFAATYEAVSAPAQDQPAATEEKEKVCVDGREFASPLDAALHLLWLLQRLSYYEKHREGQPADGFRFREGIIESRKLLAKLNYDPSAIANPESEGAAKPDELRSETLTAREQPHAATGLLPCPFCGNPAHVIRVGSSYHSSLVGCTECHAELESNESDWNTGGSWNKRAALTSSPSTQPQASASEPLGASSLSTTPKATSEGKESADAGTLRTSGQASAEES